MPLFRFYSKTLMAYIKEVHALAFTSFTHEASILAYNQEVPALTHEAPILAYTQEVPQNKRCLHL